MIRDNFRTGYKSIPIAGYSFHTDSLENFSMLPPLENHREFEIILIKKGHADICAGGRSFTACDGTLLFFSPYMLHSVEVYPHEEYEHSCICFDLSLISNRNLAQELEENRFTVLDCVTPDSPHCHVMRELVEKAVEAVAENPPYWEMTVKGSLALLFAYIMQEGLISSPENLSRSTVFCLRVLDYIKEHYSEPINSASAAEELFYDHSYFCRLFRKNFGISFSGYLLSFRINKAKELLEDPDISIAGVACDTGFSGSSYFVKSFRSLTGTTPKKFRETYYG